MYWYTGILGFVLLVAPFAFGFTDNVGALWTSLLVGGATVIVSWIEGAKKDREAWEYWTAVWLGVFAVIAPFIFGFTTHFSALWTSIIIGALLIIGAGSKLYYGQPKLH